jgi:hypothetical protein
MGFAYALSSPARKKTILGTFMIANANATKRIIANLNSGTQFCKP